MGTSVGLTRIQQALVAHAVSRRLYLYSVPPADVRAEEDRGVHLPHSLLRQHRSGAVG